jgi:hypothetical protein
MLMYVSKHRETGELFLVIESAGLKIELFHRIISLLSEFPRQSGTEKLFAVARYESTDKDLKLVFGWPDREHGDRWIPYGSLPLDTGLALHEQGLLMSRFVNAATKTSSGVPISVALGCGGVDVNVE